MREMILRRVKKIKISKIVYKIFMYLAMSLLAFIFIFPMLIMLSRSFMTGDQIYLEELLFPATINFTNYKLALDLNLLKSLSNTLYVIFFSVVGTSLSSSLCAYGFAKINFKGKKFVFSCVLATIMLPGIVLQIPLYSLFYNIGWLDTFLPLTVPAFLGGGAMNIFLIRQFMRGIPDDILNSAKIEGCSSFGIFWKIMFPLCKLIIIYVAVGAFLGQWNDFMGPLLYIHDDTKYTLAVNIYYSMIEGFTAGSVDPGIKMATGVLLLLPPLVLFVAFQKQIMQGVTTAGLKG